MNTSFKNKQKSSSKFRAKNNYHRVKGGPRKPRAKAKSSITDVSTLIQKASGITEEKYISNRTFKDLALHQKVKQNLHVKGYNTPTEIQDKTFEILKQGKDLLGIAETGSGKTAAFLLPIIEKLLHSKELPSALVVVPTRELALQVKEEFNSMTRGMKLYSACFIGGTSLSKDIQLLKRSPHIVIGTPGRLLDLLERRALRTKAVKTLILDEFDRMLDMGFVHDVKRILNELPQRNHTMLFSATHDKKQQSLINDILKDYETIKVTSGTSSSKQVDQDVIRIAEGQNKFDVLKDMLFQSDFERVIVFEETKYKVRNLCRKLNNAGIKSGEIHGNKSQSARQEALKAFKIGKIQVLVATDVAARGIDVKDITHVINYQLPMTYDSYIHRIGRTGRAGKTGKAFTFIGENL